MEKTIIIYTNHPEGLTEGSEVSTTTSEFEYDGVRGRFDNNLSTTACVEVKPIGRDYSEYVAGKACNGGCYGYDYYKVVRVVSIDTKEQQTEQNITEEELYDTEDILYEIPMDE